MSATRPILRYHGGKWKLADWIIGFFPPHRVYVEPYGGAASVLLQKQRSYGEVYNDLDREMVNLFRVTREKGKDLAKALELTPFARDEYRESFDFSDDPMEQARRTVIRSMMGFGSNALCREIKSGFRSNSNRSGTIPAHDWSNYPDVLRQIIERLKGVVIENKDAMEVSLQHDSIETLHYLDPPYVHSTRSSKMHGHHGYNFEMSEEQHREMAEIARELKGIVIISGYECELYSDELFADWYREERASLADGALDRTEVLWMNRKLARQEVMEFS